MARIFYIDRRPPRFELGQVVATPGALEAAKNAGDYLTPYLMRHQRGDWGTLCDEDTQANEDALTCGARLLSAYHLKDGTKVYIITEADRSSTCVLLPEEY
jgi:hypothetical protein